MVIHFGEHDPNKTDMFYARGSYVWCNGNYGTSPLMKFSDQEAFSAGFDYLDNITSCNEEPIFYLNDIHDSTFTQTTELGRVLSCNDDYASCISDDGVIQGRYRTTIRNIEMDLSNDKVYPIFPNKEARGLFDDIWMDGIEYIGCDSFKDDVLKCGHEIVKTWVHHPNKDKRNDWKLTYRATIPIQSRGDACFVYAKGDYNDANAPVQEPSEPSMIYEMRLELWQNEQQINSVGPYDLPNGSQQYINIQEFQLAGSSNELKWLITSPECLILNDESWDDWRLFLVDTQIFSAICGFSCDIFLDNQSMERFWRQVTEYLWRNEANAEFWDCDMPTETAIVSWMESACMSARNLPPNSIFSKAVAIDSNCRYYITRGLNKNYPDSIKNYYIYN